MPMPEIVSTRYVLAVRNLDASAAFYKDKLGFSTVWAGDGWHFLSRGTCFIMLGECPDDVSAYETNNHSYFAYVDVKGIDLLYDELAANGVDILSKPADRPWGQREFAIRTIDGHRIMFGEQID
jgi:catechol 2,3-dioxygenase-like lactoylglutathione lyase family enzyme